MKLTIPTLNQSLRSGSTIKPPPAPSGPTVPPVPSVELYPTPALRIEHVDEIVIGPLGQRMPRTDFDQLRSHIEARLRILPAGEIVSAKWLVGVAFWARLKSPTKVGAAIAYMARHALLPITRLDDPSSTESCALYRLH